LKGIIGRFFRKWLGVIKNDSLFTALR
jgi:hypothetical protein